MRSSASDTGSARSARLGSASIARIAVAVDGRPEGNDAAFLAAMIARVTAAEVTLVVVETAPREKPPGAPLRELRESVLPRARTVIERDRSVPRALDRVARREHHDLLVVGSSRSAPEGHARMGKRTRELLRRARCAVAVAPRGLSVRRNLRVATIGVGYEPDRGALEALEVGAALARAASALLRVKAVLDDRLPYFGPTPRPLPLYAERASVQAMWDEAIQPLAEALREDAERAALATGAEIAVEVVPGSPPQELLALSREVDLLVIGSRRHGAARVGRGSTADEVLHDASCSVMVVPRGAAVGDGGKG